MSKVCEGSGWNAGSSPIANYGGVRRVMCEYCGRNITVNRYGTLRKHDTLIGELIDKKRREREEDPVYTLLGMREQATRLKTQLWHSYEVSKDPRYQRLWQHALTLETHLFQMHVDQAYDSSTVQLVALTAAK